MFTDPTLITVKVKVHVATLQLDKYHLIIKKKNILYVPCRYGLLIDPLQVITIFLEDPYRWPSASLVICK